MCTEVSRRITSLNPGNVLLAVVLRLLKPLIDFSSQLKMKESLLLIETTLNKLLKSV